MRKTGKRFLSVLVALTMLVGLLPVMSFAADPDLTISTLTELKEFASGVNGGNSYEGKTVVLAADISLGGEASPWTPIGTSSAPFSGTFDGGKHVISGLHIAEGSQVGFFGYVKNGTVSNVIVQGSVTGTGDVGGVVGYLSGGNITACGNQAAVSGANNVGGVVGQVNGTCTISGCFNAGSVSGTTGYIGGISGYHWRAGTVENCYNVGTVTGPATVGGVTGGHKAASPVLTNCYNAGEVVDSTGSQNNIGAVMGAGRSTPSNCWFLTGSGPDNGKSGTAAETIDAAALGEAFQADSDNINNGYPVLTWQARVPDLIISSYEQLQAFAAGVNGGDNFEGKLVRLDVNVDLGGEAAPWTPIGTSAAPFSGTFDGGYHVISGLYVAEGKQVGLFGYVKNGTVSKVVVEGSVTGSGDVAGVVGYLSGGKVLSCGNRAAVSGGNNVGGVAGQVNGTCTVSGCFNSGSVTATTGYVGGVTGQHWRAGNVENCYNVGTVTGPATVGGVTGGHKAASPVLTNCYNAGSVVDASGNNNNIGAVVGASRGTAGNCWFLTGSGPDNGKSGTGADAIDASVLGDAFTAGASHPVLVWESKISTAKPVHPAFVEKTELSAELAKYIKQAVASMKSHADLAEGDSFLGSDMVMQGASSTGTDWSALSMGRFGYFDVIDGSYQYLIDDGTGYTDYLGAMKAYIEKTYADNNGILHSAKATEWHRAVVAITALGGDPTNFGTYNGKPINLIADGSYNCVLNGGPGKQGINGWIWGLIAMDTGSYEVPADAKYPRERFIKEILKMQLTDGVNGNEYGGWVLGGYGTRSDVDITGMAIQALAPYYNDDTVYTYTNEISKKEVSKTVRQCVDEALDRLSAMMTDAGGFSSWNTNNVESISQVVVALCALGINPTKDQRFISDSGKTLLDGILSFRVSGGGFCHVLNSGWNNMATDQATYALVACWRLENDMRALYDTRGNWSGEDREKIDTAITVIENLPLPTVSDYKAQLKLALAQFRAVPEAERRYVSNYSDLAAAIALVGGEDALDTIAPYVTSISVTKNPDKVRYYAGDLFDPSGMVVTAHYSDGTSKEITGYKLSHIDKLAMGTDTVYVMYGILKAPVSITVRERMPWAGEGTADDPYLIANADDLVDLRHYIGIGKLSTTKDVHFKMVEDVNMKNISDWRAIADSEAQGFRGHFDGNGHSIWNINASTYHCQGLFGKLGDGALIENVTIASGSLGTPTIFSVAGIAGCVVENATATIRNCHNFADISGCFGAGGILGSVDMGGHAIIENCSNHGTVTASYQGGGILGAVGPNRYKNSGAYADITNCYNAGKVCGRGSWGNGGILGSHRTSGTAVTTTIENCYNAGVVTGTSSGALIGSVCESDLQLKNAYYLASSNPAVSGDFTDDGADQAGTITGTPVSKTAEEMKATAFVTALGDAFAEDSQNINDGYPILKNQKAPGEEAPVRAGVEIANAADLVAFAKRVNSGENFTDKTVILTDYIDMSAVTDWVPIGNSAKNQFNGTFDGQGFAIDNFTSEKGGLFGYAANKATIRNVVLASGQINARSSFIGGILNWSNGCDILNCQVNLPITASGYSGGIVGTVRDGGESLIRGCCFTGTLSCTDTAAGGIVGHLDVSRSGTSVSVTIDSCYTSAAISAESRAAGIAGFVQGEHKIRNCYAAGSVTAENPDFDDSGALFGFFSKDSSAENCFYNENMSDKSGANEKDTCTVKTEAQMKTPEFLAALGSEFKEDPYDIANGGYPLLKWQKTFDADDVNAVRDLIDAVGNVTLQSTDAIQAAREAYNQLDSSLQALVDNYSKLTNAEAAYAQLAAAAEAAGMVRDLIDAIGEVTLQSKDAIEAARNAYDALSAEAKELVENYSTLTDAEARFAELQEEIPQTEDDIHLIMLISLLAVSMSAVVVLVAGKKKYI